MAQGRGLYANLMHSAGDRLDAEQAHVCIDDEGLEYSNGLFARRIGPDNPFPCVQYASSQTRLNATGGRWPPAPCQRDIVFVDPTVAQAFMQMRESAATLRHHQASRGFTVEPMHQRQERRVIAKNPQSLNDTIATPATAVHCHAGRFVEDEQTIVFVQDAVSDSLKN
jgi:hypothetical protein